MTYLNGKKIITVLQKVASKDVYDNVSNPNLLINGDFRVNQRGQTSYTEQNKFTVDRWKLESANVVVTPTDNGVTIQNNASGTIYFSQPIEDSKRLFGKNITISTRVNDTIYSKSDLLPTTIPTSNTNYAEFDYGGGSFYLKYNVAKSVFEFTFRVTSGQTKNINYAKVEIGSIATAYSPRPYAEELALCQRYCQVLKSQGYRSLFKLETKSFYIPLPVTLRTHPTITWGEGTGVQPVTGGSIDKTWTLAYTTPLKDNCIMIKATKEGATNDEAVLNLQDKTIIDAEIY